MTSINDCSDEDVPEIALVFENGRGSVLEASSSVSPIPPEDGPTHTEADTLSFQKEPSSLNATGMTVHSEENAVNETCDPGALAESDSQEISSQPSPFDPNVQYDNGGLDNGSVIEVTNSSLGHQETSEIQNGHSPSQEDSGDTCTPRNQTGNARDSSLAEERNGGVQDEVTEVPSNSEVPVSQSVSSSHSEPQASQENHSTGSEPIEAVSSEDQDVDGCPNESNLDASNLDAGIRVRPTGSQVGDLPVLQPLSPTHGSDLNEQYEYLRRTLSHSRRRYSTRRRNNHGSHSASQRQPRHTEGSHQRELEPRELTRARSEIHQTRQQQTIGQLRDILRNSGDSGTRLSAPSELETHVDQHGRTYYMDHSTRTIAFDQSSTTVHGQEPEMRARREMLERRYQSLQRSFRRRNARGIPSRNEPLSPILSPDNMSLSLTREEAEALLRRTSSAIAHQPSPKPRKQRTSKSSRWLSFGRRSNKQISQTGSSSEDSVLSISPRASTPPLEDSVFSMPVAMDTALSSESGVGGIEPSVVNERNSRSETPDVEQNESGGSMPRMEESEMDIEEPIPSETNEALQLREDNENHSHSDDITEGATRLVEAISAPSEVGSHQDTVPSVAELGRQHSIVRATGMSEAVRSAALKARHRVRATTVGSAVRRAKRAGRQDPLAEEEARGDTDEETNEVVAAPSRLSPTAEPPSSPLEKQELSEDMEKEEGVGKERSLSTGLASSPALKFITRKDLYSFLNSAGEPGEEFFSNRPLMELVQRIRANKSLFEKYQHSRHLVNSLNRFADVHADLPEGWEKKLNKQGKVFFMDHNNELTTFIDPRLPLLDQKFSYTTSNLSMPITRRVTSVDEPTVRPHHTTVAHSQSAPPAPSLSVSAATDLTDQLSYDDQVVAFLQQADVEDQIAQRYQRGVRPPFREVIESIRLNGTPALERIQMSGSVAAYELALVLSLFEDEISRIQPQPIQPAAEEPQPSTPTISVTMSKNPGTSTLQRNKEAFSTKLQHFKMMLARLGYAQGSRLKFNIRRDHLLEDAYEHVMKSDCRHLQKKRLTICFRGEEGLDYGGPSREFFFLLSREIFNPYYGLFEYSANDTYTVGVSPTSCFIQNNLEWFRFAGRLIGLVVAQGFLLDVFFTRTIYKSLIDKTSMLQDLESLEPAFFNSLVWIQDNDPEPLDLTFTVEEEAFGQLTTHELKPGGTDIPVTEENKQEYIQLMIHWRFDRGVAEQLESLKKGFSEIMPVGLLELQGFDAGELEFLTAGTLEIDVDDWKANTEYRNGYHPEHPVVQWFWQAVEMFDNEQRLRLLQFVTGTSSVPFEGFKALRGSTGPKKFTIDFFSDIRSLPRTHTCFNRIDLPPYPTYEILFEKLRIAVEEGSTFGIE